MHFITILTVGQIKEKHFQAAIAEYEKRLQPFVKLETVELKKESFSEHNKKNAQEKEGARILEYLNKQKDAYIVVCDETGKQFSSIELSKRLSAVSQKIIFVIGGSLGLSDEVRKKADLLLSFSDLTFPHEMFRMILLEQIYRTVTIAKKINYHY
jgi:23S rRNA (pseudouridine1915-N3)-methyltransferase